jgi:AraC-like DNA-binding protein
MWNQASAQLRHEHVRPVELSPVTMAGVLSGPGSPHISKREPREFRIDAAQLIRDARVAGNTATTSIWSARHDGSIAFIDDLERSSAHVQDDPNRGEWFDTIHPDDRPRTLASWASALRTGRPFHDVHRARERGGRYERFVVDGVAIRDEDGRTVCWIGAKTAIGHPEVDHVRPLSSLAVLAPSSGLDRTREASGPALDPTSQRSKLSAQPIYAQPKTVAGDMGAALSVAAAAPRLPQALELESEIGKSFLEAVTAAADAALSDGPHCLNPKLLRDSRIKTLLGDLSGVDKIPAELARVYSHSLSVAALAVIAGNPLMARICAERRPITPLPKWRLARVNQFIDAHMEEAIRLADLAKAAGLTKMHFAAQFRASVGMCPHEYLLRQRIRRAQTLLRDSGQRLVDVALSVGFQAQSHFTTVFRRYVGDSPHRWRLSQSADDGANVYDLSHRESALC